MFYSRYARERADTFKNGSMYCHINLRKQFLVKGDSPTPYQTEVSIRSEMITIRFDGWTSGRIVSLQPDKDIQETAFKREPHTDPDIRNAFIDILRIQTFEKVAHRTIRFIYYLQKHLFSLLRRDSESLNGVISKTVELCQVC